MKPITSFALLSALATLAAQGAVTDPVGYVTYGDTAGAADLPNNTDILVSTPLMGTTTAVTTVTSIAGQVVGLDTTTLGDVVTEPHLARFEDGTTALIVGNTASAISIDAAFDLSGVAVDDSVRIFKAVTLGTLLSDTSGIDQGGGFQVFVNSGTALGTNLAFDLIYTFYGTWFDGDFAAADDVVLYPGESFVMRNTTGSAIDGLVSTGEVVVDSFKLTVRGEVGDQDTALGIPTGVPQTPAELGIASASNDQILVFDNTATGLNKSSAEILQNFGTAIWYDGDFNDVTNSYALGGGNGYIYRREAGAGDLTFDVTPAYISSL